jgi:Methylene-tetrahydrofolate reductase C terminal
LRAVLTPSAFEPRGKRPPPDRSPRMRLWSIRHAALLERVYDVFEAVLVALAPLLARIGYERLERPFAFVEARVKGALFDCRMCGDCVLSSTGMSCPMNCPKGLRNGPCGGVRPDGGCEVYPQMPCVWVKAFEGSRLMRGGARIETPLPPVDQRLKGSSAWLRAVRRRASGEGA